MIWIITEEFMVASVGGILVSGTQRAQLPCKCRAYVGRREDNLEVAAVSRACGKEHRDMMDRFREVLKESLKDPEVDVPLVNVCASILMSAYQSEKQGDS